MKANALPEKLSEISPTTWNRSRQEAGFPTGSEEIDATRKRVPRHDPDPQAGAPGAAVYFNRVIADEALRECAYFDRVVSEEGDFNPFSPRGWRTLARRFGEMVPLRPASGCPGLRLLDIGCGTGLSRQIYADKAAEFTGMDLSGKALAVAAARFPGDTWLRGNACDIPLPANEFDAVCFSSVLHHIEDFARAIGEGFRVVRPGGYVFAFDPNLFNPAMALFRCPSSWFYSPKGVSPNERPLRPATLRAAFAKSGLVDIRQRCQADIPYRKVAPRLLNALLGIYNGADWLLERSGLGRWFGSFAITVGKKPAISICRAAKSRISRPCAKVRGQR